MSLVCNKGDLPAHKIFDNSIFFLRATFIFPDASEVINVFLAAWMADIWWAKSTDPIVNSKTGKWSLMVLGKLEV